MSVKLLSQGVSEAATIPPSTSVTVINEASLPIIPIGIGVLIGYYLLKSNKTLGALIGGIIGFLVGK